MFLKNISLFNFKNYSSAEFSFSAQINGLTGSNGCGKTNLLDAIHYLSMGKSAFNLIDSQNIRHQEALFMVKGNFVLQDEEKEVCCSLKAGEKKILSVNRVPHEKLSQHIGLFPTVMIAPNDTDIIREGSEARRKFFDSMMAQIDPDFLRHLIQYNHTLKNRNSLLKQFNEKRYFDADLLEFYDGKLIDCGQPIFEKRKTFAEEFLPVFEQHYCVLSDDAEQVEIEYKSSLLTQDMTDLLHQNLQKDLYLLRTAAGIHKDDFNFRISGYPLKKFGSQGQQKSFLIALKLAQFDMISRHKGFKPVLLLDDIFDKLDDRRIRKLMEMVSKDSFGQIFVTDARAERTQRLFEHINADKRFFAVDELIN
ncbi:MAG: DNA replication and repair protein RecF [Cytophagales bacterium]|nr:DNA replication and repair protein RecF [Cytophagales bacterium]